MKTPVLSTLLLGMTIVEMGFGQRPHQLTARPSCRQLFEQCARALPGLYYEKRWDSIGYFVRLRQQRCGYEPDIAVLATLLQIQEHAFSSDSLDIRHMYGWLNEYARAVGPFIHGWPYLGYHSSKGYNPTKYDRLLFATTTHWAADLLRDRQLDSLQAFLCRVFTGEIRHPRQTVFNDPESHSTLDTLMTRGFAVQRDSRRMNWGVGVGVWLPGGDLGIIGPKLNIVAFELGIRGPRNQLDVNFSVRTGSAAQPYTVIRQGSPYTTSYYSGLFAGLVYTHYVVHRLHWESGFTIGIGYDDLVFVRNPNPSPYIDLSPETLGTLNTNIGLRCNYFFNPYVFMGLAVRWNFVGYSTNGGTPLDGNAFTIDLLFGGNH